jgi:3-dehydroquinate synthetase
LKECSIFLIAPKLERFRLYEIFKSEKEEILNRIYTLKIDFQGIKEKFNETVFIKSLFQDKKNSHNQITMTGLSKIGFAKTGVVVQVGDVLKTIYQVLD